MNDHDQNDQDSVIATPQTRNGPATTATSRRADIRQTNRDIAYSSARLDEVNGWLNSTGPDEYGLTADFKEQRRQLYEELWCLRARRRELEAGG